MLSHSLDVIRKPKAVIYSDIRLKELLLAFVMGSFLDFDHFVASNSASLADATSLSTRPKGHAVLFVLLSMVTERIC